MQVTPLRYMQHRNKQNWEWERQYGSSSYVTHDWYFVIQGHQGEWYVYPYDDVVGDHDVHQDAHNTGLLDVRFSRRVDAVEALENLYAQVALASD